MFTQSGCYFLVAIAPTKVPGLRAAFILDPFFFHFQSIEQAFKLCVVPEKLAVQRLKLWIVPLVDFFEKPEVEYIKSSPIFRSVSYYHDVATVSKFFFELMWVDFGNSNSWWNSFAKAAVVGLPEYLVEVFWRCKKALKSQKTEAY